MPIMSGNPIFEGWYADPELHLFDGRYYVYPTTSAAYNHQTTFEAWSSNDLTSWRNEGVILDYKDVPWSMHRCAWAPSVAEKDGRYYIYFSAGDGAGLGVASACHPAGPFTDMLDRPLIAEYHHGAQPIDAHIFQDDDGRAYLYYGGWCHAVFVELHEDMVSLKSGFTEVTPEGYVEGSFMLKRKGVYYFMWSEGDWGDSNYAVAYAKSLSPLGPFKRQGCILKSDPKIGNGAGHHSVLNIPGTDDWYICYHRRPIGETAANHRVTCIDRMYFDDNGDIVPVTITSEGVEARPL